MTANVKPQYKLQLEQHIQKINEEAKQYGWQLEEAPDNYLEIHKTETLHFIDDEEASFHVSVYAIIQNGEPEPILANKAWDVMTTYNRHLSHSRASPNQVI